MGERTKPKRPDGTARPWRGMALVLSYQSFQRGRVVDIVPKWQFREIETKLGCPGARGCGDGAAAPSDIGEQPGMGEAHPEEVVAPIVASSQHDAPLVAGEEDRGRSDQDVGWECRGIGAQHAGSGVPPANNCRIA